MANHIKQPYPLRLQTAKDLECDVTEKPNGNGKIAAVYGRVSSGLQAIQSIYANQRQRDMAARASDLNYSAIISIFADLQGVSGALGPEHRPGFATLCKLVEEGIADDVFVMDFTRLVRDHIIGLDFAQICIKEHVSIIDEAGRTLDPSDKVGLILYVIQLSESVEERNRINSRLQISRRKKAEQGRNPGMSIAVGFFIDPRLGRDDSDYHRLLVYEPHAKFVRFVLMSMLRHGKRPHMLFRLCREAGLDRLPPFDDGDIGKYMETRTALVRTRRDPLGRYIVQETLVNSVINNYGLYLGTFAWAHNSEWGPPIYREGNHQPMIDPIYEPEFQRIAASSQKHPQKARGVLPLSGLIYSLNNGPIPTPVQALTTTGDYARYEDAWAYNRSLSDGLGWGFRRDIVEGPICEAIFERIKLPNYAEEVAVELDQNRQAALRQAEYYKQSRDRLENEIKTLQGNFAHFSHEKDVASLKLQIDERRSELNRLANEAEESNVGKDWGQEASLEAYREMLANIPALWQTSTDQVRNRFLKLILEAVHINNYRDYFDVTIIWFNKQEDRIRVHLPVRSHDKLKWTEEDRAFLLENFATAPWSEITARLRRSQRSIFTYARHKLKIGPHVRPRPPLQQKRWTVEEKAILQQYCDGQIAFDEMMAALSPRGEESILSKFRHKQNRHPEKPVWRHLPPISGVEDPKITAIPARTTCCSMNRAC
jgi:DNA invertase Pin-like site-specific DNA recombinase